MCKQRFCPHCAADFTSPNSIIRCPVFLHHDPPLDPRRLICPANNWTKEPHPSGLHPGAGVCPHRPGPDYVANNVDNVLATNREHIPATNRDNTNKNTSRALAPAPRAQRPVLPHEGNDLYVRPGDLFKPGMWQTVQERLYRAEAEQRRLIVEQEEREEMERERLRLRERRRQRQRQSESEREREMARERARANKERERAKEREMVEEKERGSEERETEEEIESGREGEDEEDQEGEDSLVLNAVEDWLRAEKRKG